MKNISLLDQLSSLDNLRSAWNLLNKENEDSYGPSGITIKEFSENLESNLINISTELKKKSFRFTATRAAIIKKDAGKFRPLQIPEIRDRVVLKAMAILLEDQLTDLLSKSEGVSFAYQRGKGVREAVLKMKESYKTGGKAILKADIINFFEDIQKDKLLSDFVYPNLKDKSINSLISNSMSQKLKGLNKINKKHKSLFKNAGKGIPQGNPLSPLLSNIYLAEFDLMMKKEGYALIRYADDFIIIFQSVEEAKAGYAKISALLKDNFKLLIHPLDDEKGKTTINNPSEAEFAFLSIKFDGTEIYPGKETVGYLKNVISQLIKNGDLNSQLFGSIYEAIEKWIAIYSYLDIERYFDSIDNFLVTQLTKKFGKKTYKTTKCKQLAHRRRSKQHDKSSNSFWRKENLINLLPKFIRYDKSSTTAVSVASSQA